MLDPEGLHVPIDHVPEGTRNPVRVLLVNHSGSTWALENKGPIMWHRHTLNISGMCRNWPYWLPHGYVVLPC